MTVGQNFGVTDGKRKPIFLVLYGLGVVLTVLAAAVAIWPDLEAQNFSQTFRGRDRARLNCPVVMMPWESTQVSLNLNNPLERRVRFAAISFISTGNQTSRAAEERQELFVESNDTGTLYWDIDESNRAYDFMILARVYVFRTGRIASQSATCGVWLVNQPWLANIGLRGQTLYRITMTLGLLGLFAGGWGLSESQNPIALKDSKSGNIRLGVVFTITVLLTLLFGLLSLPLAGIGAIVILILIGLSLLELPPSSGSIG